MVFGSLLLSIVAGEALLLSLKPSPIATHTHMLPFTLDGKMSLGHVGFPSCVLASWHPRCQGTTSAGRCRVTKIFTTAAPTCDSGVTFGRAAHSESRSSRLAAVHQFNACILEPECISVGSCHNAELTCSIHQGRPKQLDQVSEPMLACA